MSLSNPYFLIKEWVGRETPSSHLKRMGSLIQPLLFDKRMGGVSHPTPPLLFDKRRGGERPNPFEKDMPFPTHLFLIKYSRGLSIQLLVRKFVQYYSAYKFWRNVLTNVLTKENDSSEHLIFITIQNICVLNTIYNKLFSINLII